jgi:hypothetical protein
MSNDIDNEYNHQYIKEIAKLPIGSTVFAGETVVDLNSMKYPVFGHFDYLLHEIKTYDVLGFLTAIVSGTVSVPVSQISESGIDSNGIAISFNDDSPGVLVFENNKLSVKYPKNFLWAESVPYTYAVKTKDGLAIVANNTTIKTINGNQINNDTVYHGLVSAEDISKWYNKTSIGNDMVIGYALDNFSDNRSLVVPEKIKEYFGEDVLNYVDSYPSNRPILVYANNYSEEILTESVSVLGSYPQYGDAGREFNARQFVKSWNGTIIPPDTYASGNTKYRFTFLNDKHASGGAASHGVCPPARSLRGAVIAAGFPLPQGMNGGHEAVNYNVAPSTGILVYNPNDFPILIKMWTEGGGPGMRIHTQTIKLAPN